MCWGINQTTWTSYSWEFNDWTISPNYACVLAAQRSAVRVCGFKCVEDIQGSCCVVMCGHGQSTLLFARFKWSQIAWHRQLHRTQPVQHVRIPTSEHSWSVEQVEPSLVDRSISGMEDKFFHVPLRSAQSVPSLQTSPKTNLVQSSAPRLPCSTLPPSCLPSLPVWSTLSPPLVLPCRHQLSELSTRVCDFVYTLGFCVFLRIRSITMSLYFFTSAGLWFWSVVHRDKVGHNNGTCLPQKKFAFRTHRFLLSVP